MRRVSKDTPSDFSSSSIVCKIPVEIVSTGNPPGPYPIKGALAYDIPTNNIYFANGSEWLEIFPGFVIMTGDVTGPSNANVVSKLQGKTLTAPNPVAGNVLSFNGAAWVSSSSVGVVTLTGDVTGPSNANVVSQLQGKTLTAPNPLIGNVLTFNGAAWVPSAPAAIILAGDVINASNNNFIRELQGFDVKASVAGGGIDPGVGSLLAYDGNAWVAQGIVPGVPVVMDNNAIPTYPLQPQNEGVWYGTDTRAQVNGPGCVSLGNNSSSSNPSATGTALGSFAHADNDHSIALGGGSSPTRAAAVPFVADGIGGGIAIGNFSFLSAVGTGARATSGSIAIGSGGFNLGDGAIAAGVWSISMGSGSGTSALAESAISVGPGATCTSVAGISFGRNAQVFGTNAIAMGDGARAANDCIGIGTNALILNTFAGTTAVGKDSLASNTIGPRNTAFGFKTMTANVNGSDMTAVGYQALLSETNGDKNTAVGANALATANGTVQNTAVGANALRFCVNDLNTAVGGDCMRSNTLGGNNTAVGTTALELNTTGNNNTGMGYQALGSNTISNNNTAMGYQSLFSTTGETNTAIGYLTGSTLTVGVNNVLVGASANVSLATDSNTVVVGEGSIAALNSIVVGHNSNDGGNNNCIVLGRNATATAPNQFVLGSLTDQVTSVSPGAGSLAALQGLVGPTLGSIDILINGSLYKLLLVQ